MAEFRVSRRARLDLVEIAEYTLDQWGVEQMEDYLRGLDRRFGFLAARPGVGKACDEIRPGYRRYPQGSHMIFYRRVTVESIEIVRVLHRSMEVLADLGE